MKHIYTSKLEENTPALVAFFEKIKDTPDTVLHIPAAVDYPVYTWADFNRYYNTYASTDNFEIIKDSKKIKVPSDQNMNSWVTLNKIDTAKCTEILNQPNTGFVVTKGIDKHSPFTTNICANLEMMFNGVCGAHLYGGASDNEPNSSFPVHKDSTLNVIFQLDGESHWTVYNGDNKDNLTIVYSELLTPGDLLYIPKGMYHMCKPKSKRLSISFCCIPDIGQTLREVHVI